MSLKPENLIQIVASFITAVFVVLLSLAINQMIQINRKLDNLVITTTIHSQKVLQIESNSEAISSLQETNIAHVTKAEMLDAIEDLKDWVDEHYKRVN